MELIKELKTGRNKDVPLKIYFKFKGESEKGNLLAQIPLAKPVRAKIIKTEQGWCIHGNFPIDALLKLPNVPSKYKEILEERKRKGYHNKEIAFLISDEEKEEIEKVVERKIEEIEKQAEEYFAKRDIAYVGIGGDTLQVYVADFDAPEEFTETNAYKKWQNYWRKILKRIDRLHKIAKKTDITTLLYNVLFLDSSCWGKVSLKHPEVLKAVEDYEKEVEEKRRKKEEAERKRKKKEMEAIKEAKRTGKPVYFEVAGFIDGDNYNEVKIFCPKLLGDFGELGLITIYRVAYPDGTIKEEAVPSY